MAPKTAVPAQSSSPFTSLSSLGPPASGTVTIESNGTLSGLGTGWHTQGDVITFDPQDNHLYVLTLQPPQNWTWNTSFSLQFFQGDDNLCGFYSNDHHIQAFNSTSNSTVRVLNVILNLVDGNNQSVAFTIFLRFPTSSSNVTPTGGPFTPQPLTGLIQGSVLGSVSGGPEEVTGVQWSGSGTGYSAGNSATDGQIVLTAILEPEVAQAWHLPMEIDGNNWEVGDAPAFEISLDSDNSCGVVFAGPIIKAYNHLPQGGSRQIFNLALKLQNTTTNATRWFDDPAVVFDPPDPSGIE